MIKKAGFDVPLFTADGSSQMPNGYLPDVLPGLNGGTGQDIFDTIKKYRPNGPFYVPEYYPGWLDHWGETHAQGQRRFMRQKISIGCFLATSR